MCYRSDSGELGLRTRNLFRGLAGIDGGPMDGFLRALGIGLGRLRGVGTGGSRVRAPLPPLEFGPGQKGPLRFQPRLITRASDLQSKGCGFDSRSSQFSLS